MITRSGIPELRYWCQRGTCGVLIRKPWPAFFATADKVTECTREEFLRMAPPGAWGQWAIRHDEAFSVDR